MLPLPTLCGAKGEEANDVCVSRERVRRRCLLDMFKNVPPEPVHIHTTGYS